VTSNQKAAPPDYGRSEDRAHQLDRNWAELVQELRVIGTGVQILFAFLLTIAFQARFSQTSPGQRDLYLVTLLLSGLAAALLIAPVAMHRFLFRIGVKDRLVSATNRLSVAGLAVLSLSMVGAIVLITDWVGGTLAAALFGVGAAVVFGGAWFALPLWMRSADLSESDHQDGFNRTNHDDVGEPRTMA
jgi:MFS family permease